MMGVAATPADALVFLLTNVLIFSDDDDNNKTADLKNTRGRNGRVFAVLVTGGKSV